ncbi:hypothetical protein ACFL1Z_04505 [Thermodesulfobacteriota bacterium]
MSKDDEYMRQQNRYEPNQGRDTLIVTNMYELIEAIGKEVKFTE